MALYPKTAWSTCLRALPLSLLMLVVMPGADMAEAVQFHAFPNGLDPYHVKVDRAPVFKLSVTVWVGRADEGPKKKAGVVPWMLFGEFTLVSPTDTHTIARPIGVYDSQCECEIARARVIEQARSLITAEDVVARPHNQDGATWELGQSGAFLRFAYSCGKEA